MMSRETANPLNPQAPLTGEVVRDAAGVVFLSVAICTFNQAQMLATAARSVLEQLPRDGELLIVDNASGDETPAVTQKLAEGDDRVRIIREERPGISHARNTALHEARGTYIVFFDDDEVLEEGC